MAGRLNFLFDLGKLEQTRSVAFSYNSSLGSCTT